MPWQLEIALSTIDAKITDSGIQLRHLPENKVEMLSARFSTRADAEAAAKLVRDVYRVEDIRIQITEVATEE